MGGKKKKQAHGKRDRPLQPRVDENEALNISSIGGGNGEPDVPQDVSGFLASTPENTPSMYIQPNMDGCNSIEQQEFSVVVAGNSAGEGVPIEEIDGHRVFEGDTILDIVDPWTGKSHISLDQHTWPKIRNATGQVLIPYSFHPYSTDQNSPNYDRWSYNIEYWLNKKISNRADLNVTLIPLEELQELKTWNELGQLHRRVKDEGQIVIKVAHIHFRKGGTEKRALIGCRENILEHPVLLPDELHAHDILHEVGHALGLFHEHTRKDRDEHIRVRWGNIKPGCICAFKKWEYVSLKSGDYDYQSVMQYRPHRSGWAVDSSDLIWEPVEPDPVKREAILKQIVTFPKDYSEGDVAGINAMYPLDGA